MAARAIVSAVVLIVIKKIEMFSLPNALGVINLAIITFNRLGITLFALGDYAILFRTLLNGIPGEIARFLVWIFYVPATVLIVCNYVKGATTKETE